MHAELLKDYGIDYTSGLERCMNDEEVYCLVLNAFLRDTSLERAKQAFESKDYETMFKCAHELKGATANAAMLELAAAASALTERLRLKKPDEGDVEPLLIAMDKAYQRTREGVKLALAD